MSALDEIEQLLAEMSRAEKAQVLQWVVRELGDAFPGIESRPDINGGEPCIVRTRIPVWVLAQARHHAVQAHHHLADTQVRMGLKAYGMGSLTKLLPEAEEKQHLKVVA